VALNSPAHGGPFGLPINIKTDSAVNDESCTERLQGGAFVPTNLLTTKASAATESVGLAGDSPAQLSAANPTPVELSRESDGEHKNVQSVYPVYPAAERPLPKGVWVPSTVAGIKCVPLALDTCCFYSLMSESVYADVRSAHGSQTYRLQTPSQVLTGAGGARLDILGVVTLPVIVAQCEIEVEWYVIRGLGRSVLLSLDAEEQYGVYANIATGMVHLGGAVDGRDIRVHYSHSPGEVTGRPKDYPSVFPVAAPSSCEVVLNKRVTIPASRDMVVPVRMKHSGWLSSEFCEVDPTELKQTYGMLGNQHDGKL
jgi:hypothetical protein